MTDELGHPMRRAKIHTFQRHDKEDGGANWIARFHPYDTYPVFFHGVDEQAAIDAAEVVRTEAIEKHEAACISRQEAREKAAKTREAKAAAKGTSPEQQR